MVLAERSLRAQAALFSSDPDVSGGLLWSHIAHQLIQVKGGQIEKGISTASSV